MITSIHFGEKDGQAIHLYILRNASGDEACISTFGATLTRWTAADRDGNRASVVLGYTSLERYLTQKLPYFGPVVGRYANRIAGGKFVLDGNEFQLSKNEGENHLHGGHHGVDKKVWDATVKEDTLVLSCTSPDGEEGYPGTLQITVRFSLADDNTLTISYEATTDKPTVVNLTLHPWFNLSGVPGSTNLDHELQIFAAQFTGVGEDLIPTGALIPVAGKALDFRNTRLLKMAIEALPGEGLDHNFVLDEGEDVQASLYHPGSGRRLDIRSSEPGLQVFTAQLLDGSIRTDEGVPIPKYGAVVMEPQHFPDSPNHPHFPNTALRPGEVFRSLSRYQISVQD